MEEISVNQAAEMLGKTDRTIRNYIKEGRIKARHVENQFGWEYRIYDLGEFVCTGKQEEKRTETNILSVSENNAGTAVQMLTGENHRLWGEFKNLREANNRLAYDLGSRDQQIKDLERELEALQAQLSALRAKPKAGKKWWRWF